MGRAGPPHVGGAEDGKPCGERDDHRHHRNGSKRGITLHDQIHDRKRQDPERHQRTLADARRDDPSHDQPDQICPDEETRLDRDRHLGPLLDGQDPHHHEHGNDHAKEQSHHRDDLNVLISRPQELDEA